MNKKYDITGKTFGYLTVIEQDKTTIGERNSKWICKCKCGNTSIATRSSLVQGHTTSCGCKRYETRNDTHGLSKTRIYRIWNNMKNRCRNNNIKAWDDYGARGISVCEEWDLSFEKFYDWAIKNGYSDNLTIERINVDGNYCPDNCKWVSMEDQQKNKRNNILITYKNETKCLSTICKEIGFPTKTAYRRYARLKAKGKEITTDYLFSPIQENKISKCYRHS